MYIYTVFIWLLHILCISLQAEEAVKEIFK